MAAILELLVPVQAGVAKVLRGCLGLRWLYTKQQTCSSSSIVENVQKFHPGRSLLWSSSLNKLVCNFQPVVRQATVVLH